MTSTTLLLHSQVLCQDIFFLPTRYDGKTPACLLNMDFPKGWNVTFIANDCASEDATYNGL